MDLTSTFFLDMHAHMFMQTTALAWRSMNKSHPHYRQNPSAGRRHKFMHQRQLFCVRHRDR